MSMTHNEVVCLFFLVALPTAIHTAVVARTFHHPNKLLKVDTSVTINISLLQIPLSRNPEHCVVFTSTRKLHSSSLILSPIFIITCLNSAREMFPLPSWDFDKKFYSFKNWDSVEKNFPLLKVKSYIVKDRKCFSDILFLKIWVNLESKVRSHEPILHSQDLRCHHKKEIWKLDDSCCIFINHVYEILQFFFSGILSDRSEEIF